MSDFNNDSCLNSYVLFLREFADRTAVTTDQERLREAATALELAVAVISGGSVCHQPLEFMVSEIACRVDYGMRKMQFSTYDEIEQTIKDAFVEFQFGLPTVAEVKQLVKGEL